MSDVSFEELNATFNAKTSRPELFDCGKINLLKLFQHAVASYLQGNIDEVLVSFTKPGLVQRYLLPGARKLRRRDLYQQGKDAVEGIDHRKYLLYSGGNCLKNEEGETVSSNTVNILDALGRENCYYIYKEYRGVAESTGQDLNYSAVNYYAENRSFDPLEIRLIKDLNACLKRVKDSGLYEDELVEVFASKLQLFLNSFRSWSLILQKLQPEKIYFITHYHQEGLIAAATLLNIPKTELQHGLISENDYYYVYADHLKPVIERALFGDRIFIFGQHWGNVLGKGCEYPPERQVIVGGYQYRPALKQEAKEELIERLGVSGKRNILLATQSVFPKHYSDYVRTLSPLLAEKHPDFHIVIKPHPYQQGMDQFEALTALPNVSLCEKTDDLMLGLNISEIQISVYSTTFYDASGTGVINLTLYDHPQYRKYSELMIEEKVAFPLEWEDDPVQVAEEVRQNFDLNNRDFYYAPFNREFDQL
jgi:hypothetical protein